MPSQGKRLRTISLGVVPRPKNSGIEQMIINFRELNLRPTPRVLEKDAWPKSPYNTR